MPRALSDSSSPKFSIVSAVYNVAPYLADFIDSLEKQSYGLDRVEILMVDDGSTDESPEILERWQARHPDVVTVLRKPNGGQASARNLGIEHARGEWITFTDPDDILQPDALRDVAAFLDANPETELVALSRLLYHDEKQKFSRHPLHRHFEPKNMLRNLEGYPEHFFGSAPAGRMAPANGKVLLRP